MTPKEQKAYDDYVGRLNGSKIGEKPPFEEYSNAIKSLSKILIPQKARDELRKMTELKFGRDHEDPRASSAMKSSGAATVAKVKELVDKAQIPSSAPIARTPVYGTIPEGAAAKLTFLRESIENNVNVIHGLMEAKNADSTVDVSEVQDAVNRLNLLNEQHNQEVDRILRTIFPSAAPQPVQATGGNGVAQAPSPPQPPKPVLGRTPFKEPPPQAKIGFQMPTDRDNAPADPREVEMLRRTAPLFNGPGGPKIS